MWILIFDTFPNNSGAQYQSFRLLPIKITKIVNKVKVEKLIVFFGKDAYYDGELVNPIRPRN